MDKIKGKFAAMSDRVWERILAGPEYRQAAQAEETERVDERARLRAQLAGIRARAELDLPPLRRAADLAGEKARGMIAAAHELVNRARYELGVATSAFAVQASRIEKALVISAPSLIDEFLDELIWRGQRLRISAMTTVHVRRNRLTGTRSERVSTNTHAITAVLAVIGAARHAAEELRYEPMSDDGLAARLDALRKTIDAAETDAMAGADAREVADSYVARVDHIGAA